MDGQQHRNGFYTLDGVEFEGEDVASFRRGPQGEECPDGLILKEAGEILKNHHEIDHGGIELSVEDGCIFLKGAVESRYLKHLVEESLTHVMGVREVINQLTVRSKDVPAELSNDLFRDEEVRKQKLS